MADGRSSPVRSSAACAAASSTPVSARMMRIDARVQLGVAGPHVGHAVACHIAQPDHRHRRQHVQHELLRGAGLHARRAREHFRSDDGDDGDVDGAGDFRIGRAGHGDGERAERARVLDRADRVGRASRRGDADDGIERGDVALLEIAACPRRDRLPTLRRPCSTPRSRRRSVPAPAPATPRTSADTPTHRARRGVPTCRCRHESGGRPVRAARRSRQSRGRHRAARASPPARPVHLHH